MSTAKGENCGNLWQLCALATRVPKSCEYCARPNIDAPNSSPRRLLVLEHPAHNAVSILICSSVWMPEEELFYYFCSNWKKADFEGSNGKNGMFK